MKRKFKLISILASILVVIVISLTMFNNSKLANKTNIDNILESEDYSYLPVEAKEYLKGVYEETGEIVLTEKNKEENVPYLNPQYVEYLTLSEEEKEEVNVVPTMTVLDYIGVTQSSTSTVLEDYYNISSIDSDGDGVADKNYTTPMNNQGSLGLCWAFASLEQAESYLMVMNEESYSDTIEKFSIRQMDYATSSNGINNYNNENGTRLLTMGGNFYVSSFIMASGLTMVDDSLMPYDGSTTKKELVDVLNFKNSKYELNSTIVMPILLSTSSKEERDSYNNIVKENIIKYGGAYVGTGSPSGACGFKNSDGTYAMVDADDCVGTSGHAMQIIGWDDNYEYSYCRSGSSHLNVNESGSCDRGTLISDKGAWILRNSWGDSSEYKYVYLGFSSYGIDIGFTTSLSKMSERSWDNTYYKSMWLDGTVTKTEDSIVFNKKINNNEIVEKVKFMSASMNGIYSISIETENNKYNDIKTVEVNYPGIYTIDLSSENILLDSGEFKVTIKSNNETNILANTIFVFTSNTDEIPIIKTKNFEENSFRINSDSNYEFIVYSDTKNIDSNSTINYSLFNENIDYSNYIVSVNNNKVAVNNVNATIVLSKDIPVGNYTLKTNYDNYEFESNILIPSIYSLEGEGTEENPYLLYTEDDLNQIRYNLDAYYLLKNDIVLTKEWVPIGTYNIPFRGGFDGGNHTISGLIISETIENSVGFFGYVDAKYSYYYNNSDYFGEKTYIKNIVFKDAEVSNTGNASILIGQLIFDTSKDQDIPNIHNVGAPSLTIDNVHFVGGSVTSSSGDAGIIIGNFNIVIDTWGQPKLKINNLYSSANISGFHSAGLIGYINDFYQSGSRIMLDLEMSNFQNVGILKQSIFDIVYSYNERNANNYSSVVGGLYGNAKISLSNYIINSTFDYVDHTGGFFECSTLFFLGGFNTETSKYLDYNLENGYYISGLDLSRSDVVTVDEITEESLYDNWQDFDTYWKIETIDNITRIPVLKDIDYNYTNASDINLKLYDKVSLLDYIEGISDYQYVSYEIISNDNVVAIDYTMVDEKEGQRYYNNYEINALSKGTAVVRIINHYDGFEKEININVTADKVEKPVITYYFDDKDDAETYTQTLNALEKFNLTKNKFQKLGYKFKEWNTISDGTGISYSDEALFENGIDENLRLYAQWESIEYTIKFDANSGTGTMSNSYIYVNSYTTLSTNAFTREGYTFTGWNTKADGTGIAYENRARLEIDENLVSSIDGEIITLYAQWDKLGLNLDKDKVYLAPNDTEKLTVKLVPDDSTVTYTWTSSDDSIVSVDNDGNITGKNIGTATITVTSSNGFTTSCEVTVSNYMKGDMNKDGSITITDVIKLLRVYLGLDEKESDTLTLGDMNEDGSITITDVIKLLRIYLNLE